MLIQNNGLLAKAIPQAAANPPDMSKYDASGFVNMNAERPPDNWINYDKEKLAREKAEKEARKKKGMSVICTRYYELGFIKEDVYLLDVLYGNKLMETNPGFYLWYRSWAVPLTNHLTLDTWYNSFLTYLLWPFVYCWSKEMMQLTKHSKSGNIMGRLILFCGNFIYSHTKEKMIEIIKHHFIGGVYCKEVRIPHNCKVQTHKHTYDHMSILLSGCVALKVGKQETKVHYSPAIIEIKASVEHSIIALNGDAHWLCIHATQCEDENLVDELLIEPIKPIDELLIEPAQPMLMP